MLLDNKHHTPEWITELSDCEVFVFGSNLEGHHIGGAARMAYEKFGAEWGVGVGPTGRCYAIPTMHGGLDAIKPYVEDFIDYAAAHPMQRFLLTRVGCGIAGFADNEMARLFWRALDYPNITHPHEWLAPMVAEHSLMDPCMPAKEIVNYASEGILCELCEKYAYQIGAGIIGQIPDLRIRYVKGENEFGYANLRNFYFYKNSLYVWDHDDRWADSHDQHMVEEIFHDQCHNRGYFHRVIFAGVQSRFKDTNNEYIYTGDVVHIQGPRGRHIDYTALDCTANMLGGWGDYLFRSPKHDYGCLEINRNKYKLTRVGTLFFNLNEDRESKTIKELCDNFVKMSSNIDELLQKAVITPSIGDSWQQRALGIIGAEYHWNK